MTRLERLAGGRVGVVTGSYELWVDPQDGYATLVAPAGGERGGGAGGGPALSISMLAALDTTEGRDETSALSASEVEPGPVPTVTVERSSSRWTRASTRIACHQRRLELTASVEGKGTVTEVHLLGGRSTIPGGAFGFFPSGSSYSTLFSPNPEQPPAVLRSTRERAVVGVCGDGHPGRGAWFFVPAPLLFALAGAPPADGAPAPPRWTTIAIDAPVEQLCFTELAWLPAHDGFSLRLDYEGRTRVDGRFDTPSVVVEPGHADPYAGLRAHRQLLVERSHAPSPRSRDRASWWTAPQFCGWGAQGYLASRTGSTAQQACTQKHYDAFLDELESHDLLPGTVVVDDGWQGSGGAQPDRERWPDLAGWIRRRHAAGQRVLLWWNPWDTTGVTPELCIRDAAGAPIAIDPRHPSARDAIRQTVEAMLCEGGGGAAGRSASGGLGADGLKVDFLARAPSGQSLVDAPGPPDKSRTPSPWGIALLHLLLATVYNAAKEARADALVITHAVHPAFADVSDMIRLNDMIRLEDPRPVRSVAGEMRYRAAVARAACPELLVDTDDWCAPDLAAWREYLAEKSELGVPALYYTTHLDRTGEALEERDYEALRGIWRRARLPK